MEVWGGVDRGMSFLPLGPISGAAASLEFYGKCPGCGHHVRVMRDGKIGLHRDPNGLHECRGSFEEPVPYRVPPVGRAEN